MPHADLTHADSGPAERDQELGGKERALGAHPLERHALEHLSSEELERAVDVAPATAEPQADEAVVIAIRRIVAPGAIAADRQRAEISAWMKAGACPEQEQRDRKAPRRRLAVALDLAATYAGVTNSTPERLTLTTAPLTSVPEPASLALLAGALGLLALRRRI